MEIPTDYNNVKNSKEDEISLKELILKIRDWWTFFLSKWIVIVVVGILGGVLGLVYASIKKPLYKAELSFALEDEKSTSGFGSALGLASQFGIDLGGGGGAFSGDNLLELLKSRSMVEKTLLTPVNIKGKVQTLAELYISFSKLPQKWQDKPELKNIHFLPETNRSAFSLQQDSVLGVLYRAVIKDNLSVDKIDKKLSIINLVVNSENELFSKLLTEVLAKTVSDFYIDTKTKKSVQNVTILQHQTDSVRMELNAAISGVASSIDAIPNANPGRQILRTSSQHRQIDVQADQAILTELVKNLEISKVSLRKETPLIQIIDRPILPLEKTKFGKIKGFLLGAIILLFIFIIYLIGNRILKSINK